jgi:altronate dehydratase large subunit
MERAPAGDRVRCPGTQPTSNNIDGGVTTIEEKSLGAVLTSGYVSIHDIVDYWAKIPGDSSMYIVNTRNYGAVDSMIISTGALSHIL